MERRSQKDVFSFRDPVDAARTAWLHVVIATPVARRVNQNHGETQMPQITTDNQLLNQYLDQLEWMIADAKRELAGAAKAMARRAAEAVESTDAMLADQPCSMMWVDFAESDLRNAREAKARLSELIEKQKMLRGIANCGR
jgi:outer membrane murein-binding lipoprotein Lpp